MKTQIDNHLLSSLNSNINKGSSKVNLQKIKETFNIKYQNDVIDLSNKDKDLKSLGKVEFECLSKELFKFAENYRCEEFVASNVTIPVRSLKNLSLFFCNCNTIKYLDLSECSIGDVGCRLLSEAFAKGKNIAEINLQKNLIGDVGAEILSNCIKLNNNLTKLELEHNLIGNIGGEKLLCSLKENNKIKWLNLFGNNSLDNNIITLISGQLRSNRISNRANKIKSKN